MKIGGGFESDLSDLSVSYLWLYGKVFWGRGGFLGSRLDIVFDPETRGQEVDDIPGFGVSGRNALFGSWAQTRLV